jgi:hypothetical protein
MIVQKRKYKRIIKQVTDQLVSWTIELKEELEKVLFSPSPHFLLLIFTPCAHLAHCLFTRHHKG